MTYAVGCSPGNPTGTLRSASPLQGEARPSAVHRGVRKPPSQPLVTDLIGPLEDQAVLQGVLDMLFMLNMSLMLVEHGASSDKTSDITGILDRKYP